MNNRELYKAVFNKVKSSEYKTMEEIMGKNKKNFRVSRRLVTVMCCILVLLAGTVTVNAATGGAVGQYFDNLFGGNDGVAEIVSDVDGETIKISIPMNDCQAAIFDGDNNMVRDITNEEAHSIKFTKDNQRCTFDGKEYRVLLVCGIDEKTGECQSVVRLYDPADFEKATKTFKPESVFEGEGLTVFCPYIAIE